MNDIDDDVDLHPSSFRLSLDAVDLVRRAVDEDDPGAPMFGVTALCFLEDR